MSHSAVFYLGITNVSSSYQKCVLSERIKAILPTFTQSTFICKVPILTDTGVPPICVVAATVFWTLE